MSRTADTQKHWFRKDVNDKYSMCILCMVLKKISNFQLGFQLTEMTHIHVMNSFDVIMCTVKYAMCCALLTYNRYSRQIMTKWLFGDNENGGFFWQLKGFFFCQILAILIGCLVTPYMYVTLCNIILMFFLAINCRMLILAKILYLFPNAANLPFKSDYYPFYSGKRLFPTLKPGFS